ncbi:unannotated protein [freshwater metagenome]|uniref:Unannotated protein n=1 Tax=freshwater metagenome TaxID=449393 RepID=A0A6J7G6E6_9ZZZZ|nr:DUF1905 domain-containing protein [Actinomycetota bacterium]MSZ41059.1 DUF1905 domain-containing protein [Actinomycetota bacterium]
MEFTFSGEVWIYSGEGAWYFVTMPNDLADEIQARTAGIRRGFGSLRVQVTIGESNWATSLFRESKSGSYILPLKKEIRSKEKITEGDLVSVCFTLADL